MIKWILALLSWGKGLTGWRSQLWSFLCWLASISQQTLLEYINRKLEKGELWRQEKRQKNGAKLERLRAQSAALILKRSVKKNKAKG
ncbi:hypothetical protein ES707_11657 [subsurface metagenome]